MTKMIMEVFINEGSDIIEHLNSITIVKDGEVIETHFPKVEQN